MATAREFRRIAIVNRGEPAMRLINAVREYNRSEGTEIVTIALYTEPDRGAMFVREADVAFDLGAATYTDANGQRRVRYLDHDRLTEALLATEADAVWVGWGFVAEQAEFVDLCDRLGIVFIGPDAGTMRRLGDKITSKKLAEASDVPVSPWSGGAVDTIEQARAHAAGIGYPVMIKATAGGGGRGIRRVDRPEDLEDAFVSARSEAAGAFGNDAVFIEKLMPGARHIEVQIIADGNGTVWPVGVRDCSVQRRNQKILEEAPSPGLTPEQDAEILAAAARLGRTAEYTNAGTVEFLYDPVDQTFWFMEVNARLQVEHPVTEVTTGLDMVKLQLHVARGGTLDGEPPARNAVAIEARLNAEDPQRGFAPSPGTIDLLRFPVGPGVRVDTGIEEGDSIAAEYDSMIAKIIAFGATRDEALARLGRALQQTTVIIADGMTNKAFLQHLLTTPEVQRGEFDVGWVDRTPELVADLGTHDADVALIAAAIATYRQQTDVEIQQFRSSAVRGRPDIDDQIGMHVDLRHNGQDYTLEVFQTSAQAYRIEVDGHTVTVQVHDLGGRAGSRFVFGARNHHVLSATHGVTHFIEVDGHTQRVLHDEGGVVRAPSPSVVVSLLVAEGDQVQPGDRLAVIEAMKMETAIVAEFAGTVREIRVGENSQVGAGAALMVLEPASTDAGLTTTSRVDFGGLATSDEVVHDRCLHYLEAFRQLLLGYDIDAGTLAAMGAGGQDVCAESVDPHEQAEIEGEILTLFVNVISLFRRDPVDEELDLVARRSSEEYLFNYLRRIEAQGEGLPDSFLDQLRTALAHFGIESLEPSGALEDALFRIARSAERMPRQIAPVLRVLEHRLDHPAPSADATLGGLLDRVVRETRHRFPAVHDLAAELRYQNFDQPFLDQVRLRALEDADQHLAALGDDPVGPQRDAHIEALVNCTQPLKTALSQRFSASSPETRCALLEVMTRRYYRIRALEDMTAAQTESGFSVVSAAYEHEGAQVRVFSTHVEFDDLAAGAQALAPRIEATLGDHDVVVDIYVWRASGDTVGDELVEQTRATLSEALGRLQVRRLVVAISSPGSGPVIAGVTHLTFRPDGAAGYVVEEHSYDLHPMMAKRLQLWRLEAFDIDRLATAPDIYLFHGRAAENPKDERLFALAEIRDITAVRNEDGIVERVPELERVLREVLGSIRRFQARRPDRRRLLWNRIFLYVWPTLDLSLSDMARLAERMGPESADLGIEKVVILATVRDDDDKIRSRVFDVSGAGGDVRVQVRDRADEPLEPLDDYGRKVVALRGRSLVYPYDMVEILAPPRGEAGARRPPGEFVEYDVEDGRLVPVDREPGNNTANIVVGVVTNFTAKHPEGMRRVILLGDPTRGMGSLSEPECLRINLAMDLADERRLPLEWFAVSAGALISMDSGTENMDWIARVLRRIIEFTQAGGEINIVVPGINVGAQPYWNAEATMLMHTKGILVMTADGAMVLTGKEALEYSGGVSAEDNQGIGGYERIMGPNGQAQYFARDLDDACRILLAHYDHTYVAPGERFPRPATSTDPADRDICSSPHGGDFETVGQVFSDHANPDRKRPFEIRRVMEATIDQDQPPLERWYGVENGEIPVVWDAHIGGYPVCLIGIESKNLPRSGFVPADGPEQWTAGTLFPMGSKKVARAINAASGNRPLVVLANLSGFDGSPESLRAWQLEYGAEIGRAVVNFEGPIVFAVISRYHGGAFVVFSGTLHDNMEVVALEGSRASVIGGAPAAAVVFAREVQRRTAATSELVELESRIAEADGATRAELRARLLQRTAEIHAEKLREVADEFDSIHSVERALRVGSLDRIISADQLRPYLVDALERGMARELERQG